MKPTHRKFGGGCSYLKTITLAIVLPTLLAASSFSVRADGCFVFKWDKQTDINEPTQKAIILHDVGREDLLLQVKYEGPLEEFGWLIPVPAVPTVEQGSMQPFYELSQLTQRRFGVHAVTMGLSLDADDDVKVIETKTVGAYEVTVLSARDAGSLARWLQANDYSIPEDKTGIIDDYIHKGWCFVAAKIQLNRGVAFKLAPGASPNQTGPTPSGKVIQQKLASGELHPLLISFDTPTCIFPLKISAVGGTPSEVSLYVLSAEPLLNKFTFDEALGKIERERAAEEQLKPLREKHREISMQNTRSMFLAVQMYSLDSDRSQTERRARDWTLEDLVAIDKESQPATLIEPLDEDSFYSTNRLLYCMPIAPDQIPQCTKDLPRLKGRNWYLTKQVRTFQPDEMRDLEFQPAIPSLAAALPRPGGASAAGILSQLGADARTVLLAACRSTNSSERIHASATLQNSREPCPAELMRALFNDALPQVRLNAVLAAAPNWDARFVDPLIALFRDPQPRIRMQAAQWLGLHETSDRAPVYLKMLQDPDPDVQACALRVLQRVDSAAIPRAELLRLLGSSRLETVSMALSQLQAESPGPGNPMPGFDRLTGTRGDKIWLSSADAAPLTTNSLTMARLMGLQILRHNADAEAVDLSLPLLSDANSIVRSRAFTFLRTVSGQDFPQNDRAKWELWWAVNRATFHPRNNSD
jgi:hypothetical protein